MPLLATWVAVNEVLALTIGNDNKPKGLDVIKLQKKKR